MADLDALLEAHRTAAQRAAVVNGHLAQIAAQVGLEIAARVDPDQVAALLVGAGHRVDHAHDLLVGHRADGQVDRTEIAHRQAGQLPHPVLVQGLDLGGAEQVLQLDRLHLAVAAHQRRHRLAVGQVEHGLDQVAGLHTQVGGDRGHLLHARGLHRHHGLQFRRGGFGRRQADRRLLDVGRVAARLADDQGVLAGLGQHHELVRERAADGAAVRLHGAELEAAAGEDAVVGLAHGLVAAARAGVVLVERIGVLHDELAAAHEPEARADLVAELGLDLVEIDRQLAVGLQFATGDVRDHLLVGGPQAVVAVVPVAEAEQFRAVLLPATRLLPQVARLHHGHEDLLGAGAVHLLADDGGDPLQGEKTERQKGVHAGGELADEAAADQQLVADDIGFGRHFLGGGQQHLGVAHNRSPIRLVSAWRQTTMVRWMGVRTGGRPTRPRSAPVPRGRPRAAGPREPCGTARPS